MDVFPAIGGPASHRRDPSKHPRLKLFITLSYGIAFMLLGVVVASIGPTLIMLAENTGSTAEDVAFVFPLRSLGYLVGSVATAPAFDRVSGHKIMVVALSLTAIGTALIPLATSVPVLAAMVATAGLAMGALDSGCNVLLIWLHGDRVAPYMQTIHFLFALGAFASPLLVAGFTGGSDAAALRGMFWLVAGLFVPLIVSLCWLPSPMARVSDHVSTKGSSGSRVAWREIGLVVCAAGLLGLYVGMEVSYGAFIFSYAVRVLGMADKAGDYLTSIFWGALTLGRLLAVGISMAMSARNMLILDLGASVGSILVFALFPDVAWVAWVTAATFGLAMASVFPTVFNLCESYLDLTAKLAAGLVVGASLGEMVVPLTLTLLFRGSGDVEDGGRYRLLGVVLTVAGFVMVAFFVAMLRCGSKLGGGGGAAVLAMTSLAGGGYGVLDEDGEVESIDSVGTWSDVSDVSDGGMESGRRGRRRRPGGGALGGALDLSDSTDFDPSLVPSASGSGGVGSDRGDLVEY